MRDAEDPLLHKAPSAVGHISASARGPKSQKLCRLALCSSVWQRGSWTEVIFLGAACHPGTIAAALSSELTPRRPERRMPAEKILGGQMFCQPPASSADTVTLFLRCSGSPQHSVRSSSGSPGCVQTLIPCRLPSCQTGYSSVGRASDCRLCRNQMVPGSIPGGRIFLRQSSSMAMAGQAGRRPTRAHAQEDGVPCTGPGASRPIGDGLHFTTFSAGLLV